MTFWPVFDAAKARQKAPGPHKLKTPDTVVVAQALTFHNNGGQTAPAINPTPTSHVGSARKHDSYSA